MAQRPFVCFVEVGAGELVRATEPDFALLAALDTRGVIVTSASGGPDYDFVSRFFAPGLGIDEDPVTGSAHCALGPYWSQRLDKQTVTGYQASKRGGYVTVENKGDRVLLQGKANTVVTGKLNL